MGDIFWENSARRPFHVWEVCVAVRPVAAKLGLKPADDAEEIAEALKSADEKDDTKVFCPTNEAQDIRSLPHSPCGISAQRALARTLKELRIFLKRPR